MIYVKPHIYIFVEGVITTGFGHISRELILAQKFKALNYGISFIVNKNFIFNDLLYNEGFDFQIVDNFNDKIEILNILNRRDGNKICLIDLVKEEYHKLHFLNELDNAYIVSITLFLFEVNNRYEKLSFFPDFTQNRKEIHFANTDKELILYSGKEYFVFRDEFKNLRKYIKRKGQSVLITMGGTDPFGLSLQVLEAIKNSNNLEISVLLNKKSPTFKVVYDLCKDYNIQLIQHTNTISKLMLEHDIIILNGGSTRYEACLCHTPFIAIAIHQIQFDITEKLTNSVGAINLGIGSHLEKNEIKNSVFKLLGDYEKRNKISKKMKDYLDTDGDTRVTNTIIKEYKKRFHNEGNN